ncbi:MAG: hypothetical protein ACRCX2_21635 [Paraclostridium sp.]
MISKEIRQLRKRLGTVYKSAKHSNLIFIVPVGVLLILGIRLNLLSPQVENIMYKLYIYLLLFVNIVNNSTISKFINVIVKDRLKFKHLGEFEHVILKLTPLGNRCMEFYLFSTSLTLLLLNKISIRILPEYVYVIDYFKIYEIINNFMVIPYLAYMTGIIFVLRRVVKMFISSDRDRFYHIGYVAYAIFLLLLLFEIRPTALIAHVNYLR